MWLSMLGADVSGYSLIAPTTPSLFDVARVRDLLKASVVGDVRDLPTVLHFFESQQPEIVVHMAAQSLVRASYQDPVSTYATNVMGTVHVLEAVRTTPSVRAAIVVTSDKCYENREWEWGYRENDPLGGYDPYSNSKGCAELVTAAYRQSFCSQAGPTATARLASVRAGNVIGGGDWAVDRLVPDTMNAFLKGDPVRIRRPESVRPWQHVLDPLAGYLLLAERLFDDASLAEPWNFGADQRDTKPVQWIVDRLAQLWGNGARSEIDADISHPHEARYLRLDCSRATDRLGWTPRLPLASALEWVVQWYRAIQDGSSPQEVSLQQITNYQQLS